MTRILTEAVEAANALPDGLQDEIGRTILVHVRKLAALQAEVGRGLESLAETGGKELTGAVWREMKTEAIRRASRK